MYWRLIIIALALVVQGCVQPKQAELPVTSVVQPQPQPKPRPEIEDVVILVSEDTPAYTNVAKALARHLGQHGNIRFLSENLHENIKMVAAYKNDEKTQFVSIGLAASVAAKTLANRQVVFCQVFNYKDYDLFTARHKGVSMMPSMSKIFGTWRALAPDTTDIGVISGPGFEDMMQVAKSAAKNHGITLHHEVVTSDKEYQFAYKQMANNVQGYLLLPDNRVLSGNVLHDVMTFSVRNSKQVAVFSEELLSLGGLFSVTSDPQNVAQQVLERLEQSLGKDDIPGPDIVYLDKLILHINPVMAQRLNLEIPEQYKRYENP
jgi:ABC-type uncharacterized transport system substrate-binding protein